MPEFLGPVAIPEPGTAGVFPVTLDYSSVEVREPQVVIHRFGTLDAKVEQRFFDGPGVRRFQVQLARLTPTRRSAVVEFFEGRRGSYQPFTLQIAEPDGTVATYTARFAEPTLSLDASADGAWRGSVELVEVPTVTPSYAVTSTETRFPGSALKAALLAQTQVAIPLVRIAAAEHILHLSDRRVTVGGNLYQPRLMSWGGISQTMGEEADQASFVFGNGDRVFTSLINQVDLFKAEIEFSVFHAGTLVKIDIWKGFIGSWSFDGGPEFRIEAHDGLHALRLGYPARKIVRQDPDPRRAFAIPNQPVNVGGKKGISRITSVSVANDTAYGRPVKDIWVNSATALPVECDVIAGRDESGFYAALGVVGRGPLSGYGSGHTLDGQPHHGPGNLGLRRAYGGTPTTGDETAANFQPDPGSDSFALDAVGAPLPVNPLDGVALLQIRRTDERGLQAVRAEERRMTAYVTAGLGGWTWSGAGPYSRNWQTALTNPIWIAINTYLNGLGLLWAADAEQQACFDVSAAIAAAANCDAYVDPVIGTGTERQFTFQGIIGEEKPLRDWIEEILSSCLGYATLAFGKLKFGIRSNSSTIEAFTEGNILFNSLQLSSRSPRFNDLTVAFSDVDYGYQQNTVNLKDSDHIGFTGTPLKANVNLLGVTSKSQAARITTVKLREELGGLTQAEQRAARRVEFRTTILALNVEPGMVCSMTHPDMPGGTGEFRVTNWRLNPDWSIDVAGETTCDAMYDLAVGDKPDDVVPEPLPTAAVADLRPAPVSEIELADVQFDGLAAQITLRYTPPEPLGVFRGVAAYARMPADSEAVPADVGAARFEPNPQGRGLIRVTLVQPASGDQQCRIWLCSQSSILTVPLDLETTPSIAIDVQAATPVSEVAIADITDLVVSHQIKDGRVLITLTGSAPADSLFAGAEVFLEIPQASDADPEHPTLPGMVYPQGWHFGEPETPWSASLDLPCPPASYLASLAEPKITWVVYALSRTWGSVNRFLRLESIDDPMLRLDRTPAATVTIDFTEHLGGLVDDSLQSVTLAGEPRVTATAEGIQIEQDYVPPYIGVGEATTIGEFEGVAVAWESSAGSVSRTEQQPYTAEPYTPGANVETVRVVIPKPAQLPETVYLHLMSYSPTGRQRFKRVVNQGVATPHAQYAISTVTIASSEATAPSAFSVVFDGWHSDGAGVRKGKLISNWTRLPGELIYGLWFHEGSAPPSSPSQWLPTDVNVTDPPVSFWIDPVTEPKRIYFSLVYQTKDRALLPADFGASLPIACLELTPPAGLDTTQFDKTPPPAPAAVTCTLSLTSGADSYSIETGWTPGVPTGTLIGHEWRVQFYRDNLLTEPDGAPTTGYSAGATGASASVFFARRPIGPRWARSSVRGVSPAGIRSAWADATTPVYVPVMALPPSPDSNSSYIITLTAAERSGTPGYRFRLVPNGPADKSRVVKYLGFAQWYEDAAGTTQRGEPMFLGAWEPDKPYHETSDWDLGAVAYVKLGIATEDQDGRPSSLSWTALLTLPASTGINPVGFDQSPPPAPTGVTNTLSLTSGVDSYSIEAAWTPGVPTGTLVGHEWKVQFYRDSLLTEPDGAPTTGYAASAAGHQASIFFARRPIGPRWARASARGVSHAGVRSAWVDAPAAVYVPIMALPPSPASNSSIVIPLSAALRGGTPGYYFRLIPGGPADLSRVVKFLGFAQWFSDAAGTIKDGEPMFLGAWLASAPYLETDDWDLASSAAYVKLGVATEDQDGKISNYTWTNVLTVPASSGMDLGYVNPASIGSALELSLGKVGVAPGGIGTSHVGPGQLTQYHLSALAVLDAFIQNLSVHKLTGSGSANFTGGVTFSSPGASIEMSGGGLTLNGGGGSVQITSQGIWAGSGAFPTLSAGVVSATGNIFTMANITANGAIYAGSRIYGAIWDDIAQKPTTFSPSAHTHSWADVYGKPTTFAPEPHSHDWETIQNKPATFAPAPHYQSAWTIEYQQNGESDVGGALNTVFYQLANLAARVAALESA